MAITKKGRIVHATKAKKKKKKGAAKKKAPRSGPKYPDIEVNISGIDGNAFSIMGAVAKGLRRGGVSHEEIEEYKEESKSGDYDHLIQTAMRWVETT